MNENNNEFRFKTVNSTAADSFDVNLKLDNRNYSTVQELATNFADKIRAKLATSITAATVAAAHTFDDTISNTKIVSFTINTTGNHPHPRRPGP